MRNYVVFCLGFFVLFFVFCILYFHLALVAGKGSVFTSKGVRKRILTNREVFLVLHANVACDPIASGASGRELHGRVD